MTTYTPTANTRYLEKLNFKQLLKTYSPKTREEYQRLQEMAKSGPLFNEDVIGEFSARNDLCDVPIAFMPKASKHIVRWWANQRNHGRIEGYIGDVVDFLLEAAPENLDQLTYADVEQMAAEWHATEFEREATFSKQHKTHNVVWTQGDYEVVRLTVDDLDAESDHMGHCVRTYRDYVLMGRSEIYSLRGPGNKPLATMEWITATKSFSQCVGRFNKLPTPEIQRVCADFMRPISEVSVTWFCPDVEVPVETLKQHLTDGWIWNILESRQVPEEVLLHALDTHGLYAFQYSWGSVVRAQKTLSLRVQKRILAMKSHHLILELYQHQAVHPEILADVAAWYRNPQNSKRLEFLWDAYPHVAKKLGLQEIDSGSTNSSCASSEPM